MTLDTINIICITWSGIALVTFILLQFVTAPYGRHISKGWGIEIKNSTGWMLMELPSFLIILYFVLDSDQSAFAFFLSTLWLIHYFNRAFIFPFKLRTKGKKMPIAIVGSAVFFNLINAGLNGYFLANLETYTAQNFTGNLFYIGWILFALGFIINQVSDHILIHLRQPEETTYKIPRGFLFNLISCPNHLGEIMQWTGYAIMAWNWPASTFLIWTIANLLPRALKHHKWYHQHFKDYPKRRKAIIPFIL